MAGRHILLALVFGIFTNVGVCAAPMPVVPLAVPTNLIRVQGFVLTEPAPAEPYPWLFRARPAIQALCPQDHNFNPTEVTEGAADTAIAKLLNPTCPRTQHVRFEPGPSNATVFTNIELINQWLRSVGTGQVGTDMSTAAQLANATMATVLVYAATGAVLPAVLAGAASATGLLGGKPCTTTSDYDMGLVGLIRVLHLFGWATSSSTHQIDQGAYNDAVDRLLTETGGADQWSDHPHLCGIAIPVPETENHVWMTESSRYLSNQLVRARTNPTRDPAIDAQTGNKYVNDKNGLRDKLLDKMAKVLADDFHEYNARPYARLTARALENLFDFAEDHAIRRGARMVLDYISAKYAASSLHSRRAAPYRRLREHEAVPDFFGDGSDEETWRFLQLAGATTVLTSSPNPASPLRIKGWLPDRAELMVVTSTSSYRVPDLITDLIVHPASKATYFQRFKHEAYELYLGQPKFLISAGGVYREGWKGGAVVADVGAVVAGIMSDNILGGLLTKAVATAVINTMAENDAASALPTTLILTSRGMTRDEVIRIEGPVDHKQRNNTCVGPDTSTFFACGLDVNVAPALTTGRPESCFKFSGNWIFVDLATTAHGCGADGIFLVIYRSPCDDSICSDKGSGATSNFGFFEVVEASVDNAFDLVIARTLSNNGGRMFASRGTNAYKSFAGPDIRFDIDAPTGTWPIIGNDTRDMTTWALARGNIVNNLFPRDDNGNLWRHACVEVDNVTQGRRRILDFSDARDPRWCEVRTIHNGAYPSEPMSCETASGFIRCGCARERCPPRDVD